MGTGLIDVSITSYTNKTYLLITLHIWYWLLLYEPSSRAVSGEVFGVEVTGPTEEDSLVVMEAVCVLVLTDPVGLEDGVVDRFCGFMEKELRVTVWMARMGSTR